MENKNSVNTARERGYYTTAIREKFANALREAREALRDAPTAKVSISNANSKMGAVSSVSLLPFITCPACCANTCGPDCYAAKLANLRPSVLKAWARNTAILFDRPADYWQQVEQAIVAVRFFRFHVAGDIVNRDYFKHVAAIAQRNPHTEILLFTKRFDAVNTFLQESGGNLPCNLHVMFSGWANLAPANPYNLPETNVYTCEADFSEGWLACGGNCFNCACRGVGCWQAKNGDTIAFKKH